MSKSWNGNTSDTQIFQEWSQVLTTALRSTLSPQGLSVDSKFYHDANAANLVKLGSVRPIHNTIDSVSQVISQAFIWDK